jgi:hypothetical protein
MGAFTLRAGPADLIAHHGRILTMDAAGTVASALAVRDGTVQATGSDAEVLAAAGRQTQLIDLGGRTVVPGLIDAHTHVELTSYSRHFWHDVRGLSEPDILERVAELTAAAPPGEWVILQGTFGQRLPGRAALDRVSPARPVAVRWSMHKFQLNTAGLAAAGIDRATVPGPGVRIHRDPGGQPAGLIEEGWDLLGLAPPPAQKLAEAMAETTRELFLRHGITTISEIAASTSGLAALQHLDARQHRDEGAGVLPSFGVALTAAPGHQPLIRTSDFAAVGLRTGFGSPGLSLRAVKIFADGGRDGALRSTLMAEPAGRWGLLTRAPQALTQEVVRAAEAGLAVWIHAIGDLAQECAVTAIETLATAHPGLDHRCRIEHFGNEMYDPARLGRLVAAGGIPAPNPSFIAAEPDNPDDRLPPGVVKYGMRSLLAAGARPPGNSDTAGAQPFACNPWYVMHCMVNRENRTGLVIDPGEAITVREALRSFTVDAAYACRMEADRGSLEPGKRADLAVLTADPLSVPAAKLRDITSVLTMVAGRAGHDALTATGSHGT